MKVKLSISGRFWLDIKDLSPLKTVLWKFNLDSSELTSGLGKLTQTSIVSWSLLPRGAECFIFKI